MIDSKTKKIAVSALLVALSMVYIAFMFTFDLGIWSFTPFSHIFIMLGTFISPYVGIFTSIGTFFGFFFKGQNPFVLMRAGSHIIFVLALIIILKKVPMNSLKNLIITAIVVALIHSLFEISAVYVTIWITGIQKATDYILISCGIGTFLHSVVDFFAAYGVFKLLKKAHVI